MNVQMDRASLMRSDSNDLAVYWLEHAAVRSSATDYERLYDISLNPVFTKPGKDCFRPFR